MRTLSGLSGADAVARRANAPTPPSARPTRAATWRGPRSVARTPRAISVGTVARSSRASASSCAPVGSGRGIHSWSGGATGTGSGEASNRTVAMSTPETPSTSAWWVLESSAKRSSARPSTSQISHSGRERSSAWEKIRPQSRLSWSSPPGLGSAVCRTWKATLKWGSSTQTGRPWFSGTKASRWR